MNHTQMTDVYLPWVLDPVLIGSLVTAAILYLLLAGPLRSRLTSTEKVKPWQMGLFMTALVVTFVGEASPLHELSDRYLFSAHMLQHIILSYIVAPFILWGTPGWMVRPFVTNRFVGPVFRTLTRPLVAFLVFSLGFSIWHVPFVYEAALTNEFVHHVQHVIFLALSLLVWWPLMSPLPEMPRLGYGLSVVYLVALPVGQFFASALVTFTQVSIYPTYASAPRLFNLGVMEDQALGGIIMKVGSFLVFGIPLIFTFIRWANSESASGQARVARSSGATGSSGHRPATPQPGAPAMDGKPGAESPSPSHT